MRVLVVDQDSALLSGIARTLGEYFAIDAVTNKADCLDLVRVNEFDVIVAGERLEDGSGLELLGQLERTRPDMLRIFAAERERLKLLKGRLGPFRLFRTLSYPIELRQLLAALSAAAGIEEEFTEPPEGASSAHRPEPAVRRAAPTPTQVTVSAPTRISTAAPRSRSRNTPRTSNARTLPQPTPAALALGSRLTAASRPKGFPPPLREPSARRSAFLVGAGVVVVLGTMALAFQLSDTSDEAGVRTTLAAPAEPRFPPEVVQLVADTEAALEHEHLKAARTDIAALQQIAPTHPRLRLLESLLDQRTLGPSRSPSSSARSQSRHASTRKGATSPATAQRTDETFVETPPTRRIPGATTFAGKTVEEEGSGAADKRE